MPPIPGLRESVASGFGMTNREILAMREIPKRLAVIGGGVIGLDMASYFAAAGFRSVFFGMEISCFEGKITFSGS